MASPRVKFDPERIISVAPPVNGLTTRYAPHKIPPGFASELQNFLTHYGDKVCLRGSLGGNITNGFSPPSALQNFVGYWEHEGAVIGSVSLASATRGVQPWQSIWQNNTAAAMLRQADTANGYSFYQFSTGVGAQTTVESSGSGTRDTVVGSRYTRFKSYTYGPAYDSTVAAVSCGTTGAFFRTPNKLLVWAGGTSVPSIPVPVALANGPIFCMDAQAHYERVFVLAACAPGAAPGPTTYEPNALYYTAIDGIEPTPAAITDTVARWQDQNGNLNKIFVGTADDPGIALAVVNGNLVIFKRRSVWQLYGSSPSNFVVKKVTDRFGCIDPQSVCTVNDQVTFMTDKGLMMFDGARFTDLTINIWEGQKGISQFIRTGFINISTSSGPYNCRVFSLQNDYLGMIIESVPLSASSTTPVPLFCGICYIPKASWSSFSSPLFLSGTQGFSWVLPRMGVTNQKIYLLGGNVYYGSGDLFVPETSTRIGDASSNQFEGKYGSPLIQTNPMEKSKLSQVVVEQYVRSNASVSPGALTLQDSLKNVGTIFKTFTAPTIADSQNLYVAPGDNSTSGWLPSINFNNPNANISRQPLILTPSGTNSMQVFNTAVIAEGAEFPIPGTFLSGVTYTFTIGIRGSSGGEIANIIIGIPADLAQAVITPLTTTFTKYSVSWTPTANRTGVTIDIQFQTSSIQQIYADIDTIRVSKTASTHLLEKWTNDVYSEIGPEAYSIGLTINTPNLLQYELYNMFVKYEDTRTMRPSTTS